MSDETFCSSDDFYHETSSAWAPETRRSGESGRRGDPWICINFFETKTLVHVHTEQHEAIVNSFWYVNFVAMFFSQHVGATRGYVHPETEADVGHCVG